MDGDDNSRSSCCPRLACGWSVFPTLGIEAGLDDLVPQVVMATRFTEAVTLRCALLQAWPLCVCVGAIVCVCPTMIVACPSGGDMPSGGVTRWSISSDGHFSPPQLINAALSPGPGDARAQHEYP
ncbi:hypothetical protein ElyMa_003528500 [Elysia marginata]|uniref:Uncharacterized protein n=1 Tax=Elysia marginata TaxID=1093978 RepID=A0AAV4EHP0_9GAST|nr:hypothetical protein ElyMa_003528500 [Elysia marginata]